MRLKQETHYAIRALSILYSKKEIGMITAKEVAVKGNIPVKFLYPILRKLRKINLITVNRGVLGGYKITEEINTISLYELLVLIEGDISLVSNKYYYDRNEVGMDSILDVFIKIDEGIKLGLDKIKLINLFK